MKKKINYAVRPIRFRNIASGLYFMAYHLYTTRGRFLMRLSADNMDAAIKAAKDEGYTAIPYIAE